MEAHLYAAVPSHRHDGINVPAGTYGRPMVARTPATFFDLTIRLPHKLEKRDVFLEEHLRCADLRIVFLQERWEPVLHINSPMCTALLY